MISRSSQRRGYVSVIALLCLISLFSLSAGRVQALDRRTDTAWHALAVWRQPQGLPQDTVLSLLQTRDGYLWVGTKGGVSRFDGVRFTTFDDRNKINCGRARSGRSPKAMIRASGSARTEVV